MPGKLKDPKTVIGLCLAALILAMYWPVRHCGFVDYDDPVYVCENPRSEPVKPFRLATPSLTASSAGTELL